MVEIKFPDVGEGITEGTLVKWLVKIGDEIKADQAVAEIETDKAIVEIPTPKAGKVSKLNGKEGDIIKVGSSLVSLDLPGEKAGEVKAEIKPQKTKPVEVKPEIKPEKPAEIKPQEIKHVEGKPEIKPEKPVEIKPQEIKHVEGKPEIKPPEKPAEIKPQEAKHVEGKPEIKLPEKPAEIKPQEAKHVEGKPEIKLPEKPAEIKSQEAKHVEGKPEIKPEKPIEMPSKVLATPSTRRLARELGMDISKIAGSGPGGRVTDEDVKKFAEVPPKPPEATLPEAAPETKALEERIPIKGIRKTIGERMVKSLFTAPHVVSMDEADVTELVVLREKEKKRAEEKSVKLTYLAFIVKATAVALKQHPYLNASLDPQKNEIVLKRYYNIGIAVDTPEGLMVPVIKNADQKSIMELAKETEKLAEEARTRKIKLSDLKGNTFTITNIGSIGGLFSTPIINPPDVAILGVHRIRDMAVVIDGEIKIRKILPLVLSFDHRVLDGAQAARFMNTLIDHLRDPDLLLVDVM